MIVNVGKRFLKRTLVEQEKDVSGMIMLLQRGHFLLMEPDVKNELYSLVESNLLTWQKEIFNESDELLTPTVMMKRWLTTINFYDYTERQRRILLQTPSELLVENGHNEWPVYKRIIHAYKENNTYSSVFGYIEASITNDNLKSCHLGGKSEIPATLDFKETDTEFQNLYRFKVCVLFDRDTDNDEGFSRDNSRLFMKLCNKDFNTVDCNDIYKLDFGTGYIWHSWYKRAIENYFPKSEYEKLGINMDDYPSDADSYDYIKFPIESTKEWQKAHKTKKEKKVAKYEKDLLSKIGSDMNMGDYEASLKKFNVDGINLSELELFLLKIAKIA